MTKFNDNTIITIAGSDLTDELYEACQQILAPQPKHKCTIKFDNSNTLYQVKSKVIKPNQKKPVQFNFYIAALDSDAALKRAIQYIHWHNYTPVTYVVRQISSKL